MNQVDYCWLTINKKLWSLLYLFLPYWGRYSSGGKGCRLVVGGLPVQSHPGRVEVSLSKTPPIAPDELVGTLHGCQSLLVCVRENGWMRGINCKALLIKALYKCSPFTIYPVFGAPTAPRAFELLTRFKRSRFGTDLRQCACISVSAAPSLSFSISSFLQSNQLMFAS